MATALMDVGERMNRIYDVIQAGGTLKEACKHADVSAAAHYHWLKSDAPYKAGYEFAIQIRNRMLEDVLMKRAIEGHDETKVVSTLVTDSNGNVIAEIPTEKVTVRKIDNALALRLLAANDERYNPKRKIQIEDRSKKSIAEILAEARNRLAATSEPQETEDGDAA